ncbi:MAG TPA: asparagine synthase (glutamine-hydrolyzing) [Gammaproteobacteria bacterium]|nr:asparagine synthase (glutamine-hydrolyzing) [Gammaproteobacteria bacterium]
MLTNSMCGIAGIWRRDGSPVERSDIDRMLAVVRHRGPDGFGALIERDFGLGHARLKVVDLSEAASQPMGLADGSLWLSYNGEIHNFIELRAELQGLGATFLTSGDTEVVLHALHRWGEAAFERFNGMWALALWEPRRRRLLLARDRFGIKPLFWSKDGNRFAFASEAKSILAAFPEERRGSAAAMHDYLRGGWTDVADSTFFENVRMLAPGRVLVVDEAGVQERSFWRFEPGSEYAAGGDHSAELLALLDDAVRIRMRSDVRVGVCLSGGLDSSAVARLVAKHAERPVQCFSLRYTSSRRSTKAHTLRKRRAIPIASSSIGSSHEATTSSTRSIASSGTTTHRLCCGGDTLSGTSCVPPVRKSRSFSVDKAPTSCSAAMRDSFFRIYWMCSRRKGSVVCHAYGERRGT